ncbi:flagellin [Devosia sp. XGJD_8]|uniref:flagellin N-terminal helical domain-containing protein n=1 Tax=Devosia sp. XGJD_8 TaxID=3391187 RepID=UPI003985636C
MADISLSKAVRSNLLSLKSTADMMETTQNRLATGNKVNSALDNPSSWFTAKGLTNRASDLGALIDSMANGIQTLEAADNGLSAMTKTLESMQSTLRQARQDKSFQTASYGLNKNLTAGEISFDGGAVGTVPRAVKLANEDLTATALGMNAPVAGTDGTGAAAATASSASFTMAGPLNLDDDTLSFDVVVDGNAAQSIDINAAEIAAAGLTGTSITTAEDLATVINNQLTGATVSFAGNVLTITSETTGSTSDVNIMIATQNTGADTTADATLGNLGLGAAVNGALGLDQGTAGIGSFTWGGTALAFNQDAKISFAATIDGEDQQIEVSYKDVIAAGNMDGTIDDAEEFAAILNAKIEGASVTASGNSINIVSDTFGTASTVDLTAATVTGTAYNADELVRAINADTNLQGFIRASNDNGKLRIENQSTQELNITGASGGNLTGAALAESKITGNSVRAGLADQFNELRDQLDKLADDASFNGINLLRGDKLTITFNETGTSAIDIQTDGGETVNALNLGVPTQLEEEQLDSDTTIDGLLSDMKKALDEVRSQASTFGSNLSIVQNRKSFTTAMIDTLETGAGNLTLADMNTEAANLLALQTRQQLSQNSLSLASQADQSILQLLR